jgi:hypothetical protein
MLVDWDVVGQVSQGAATVVAVCALVVSFLAERRNQKRFEEQMDESRRVAHANVRPLLGLTISGYMNEKAMYLVNHGIGAAVVTRITFRRKDETALNVPELIELDQGVVWDDFTEYTEGNIFYVPAGESETLIQLTLESLSAQGIRGREAERLMETLGAQLDEIEVTVTYEDVLEEVVMEDEQLS